MKTITKIGWGIVYKDFSFAFGRLDRASEDCFVYLIFRYENEARNHLRTLKKEGLKKSFSVKKMKINISNN